MDIDAVDADHLVLLSTEANIVEWPRPIPRGAAPTRLGERWIQGQLQWSRLTGRTSIRVPATGMCGVLVIQPFWMNDSDGRAAPVDPVAPPRRVLYLPDPILCEECVLYLACTARAPGGGEDVAGGRPARMGDVLRGILRSFRVGRWTGADERGRRDRAGARPPPRLELRGRLGDDSEIRPGRRGFDDDGVTTTTTPSPREPGRAVASGERTKRSETVTDFERTRGRRGSKSRLTIPRSRRCWISRGSSSTIRATPSP